MAALLSNLVSFVRYARLYLAAVDMGPACAPGAKAGYARACMRAFGIELDMPGPKRLSEVMEKAGPCIYVANHASALDALVAVGLFDGRVRIMAKEGLWSVPFLGRILKAEGHIKVHRGKGAHERNVGIRAEVRDVLAAGGSVFLFPEGTRTRTGVLGEFRRGAFFNAVQNGVPVVPVVISGMFGIMPKGRFNAEPGVCRVEILDPMWAVADGGEEERVNGLCARVRDSIDSHLKRAGADVAA